MKNNMKKVFLYLFLFSAFGLLLLNSSLCISYAFQGLTLWFEKMIPTLFPFMVFSGFLVRSGLTEKLALIFSPLTFIFRITPAMSYALFMGFTCGFPMGAKVISDLLETKRITKKQGEYLLAFNNNIGPSYLLGYVLGLFPLTNPILFIGGFYLCPLIYGLLLRALPTYRSLNDEDRIQTSQEQAGCKSTGNAFYLSLMAALEQINLLGGCMVLFNCLQIYPLYLFDFFKNMLPGLLGIPFLQESLSSLTEIGGGLLQFKEVIGQGELAYLWPLVFSLLTFGGLSCIFQTWFILEKTGLSIKNYIFHKINQSLLLFFLLSQITKVLQ